MKRPFTLAMAIAALTLFTYVSCSKGSETQSTEANTSFIIFPENTIGKFCFDGGLGLIGYKTSDSVNRIINFDSANFTFFSGDTLFRCRNFRIHHDMRFPTIAYLTFNGEASYRTAHDSVIAISGKFALDINYIKRGVSALAPVKKKVEHKCESYRGLLDIVFACSCCDMVYKEGVVVGCDCVCGFLGGCVHSKTIVEEGRANYPGSTFTKEVYKRIIEK